MARRRDSTDKVGLVGTGMVGSSFAYALMQSGVANHLVLIDADAGRAEGEAMDLNHGLPFVGPMQIRAGDYDDLAGCDMVVITAGASQRPGQTRLDLTKTNLAVIRDVVPKVLAANPEGVILVATNPVDILTHEAARLADGPPGRVFGSGTILDTARFRYLLGDHYGVDSRSVHDYIIGEHGDTEVPIWSLANIAGVNLREFIGPKGRGYDPVALEAIFQKTKTAAYEIIQRKKATYYAIGLSLTRIVEAVLKDQASVITVSTPMNGQHGLRDVALSLPVIVGRDGAEEALEVELSGKEWAALHRSADVLRAGRVEG
jgi:L-lactate dehydrogenase